MVTKVCNIFASGGLAKKKHDSSSPISSRSTIMTDNWPGDCMIEETTNRFRVGFTHGDCEARFRSKLPHRSFIHSSWNTKHYSSITHHILTALAQLHWYCAGDRN